MLSNKDARFIASYTMFNQLANKYNLKINIVIQINSINFVCLYDQPTLHEEEYFIQFFSIYASCASCSACQFQFSTKLVAK